MTTILGLTIAAEISAYWYRNSSPPKPQRLLTENEYINARRMGVTDGYLVHHGLIEVSPNRKPLTEEEYINARRMGATRGYLVRHGLIEKGRL